VSVRIPALRGGCAALSLRPDKWPSRHAGGTFTMQYRNRMDGLRFLFCFLFAGQRMANCCKAGLPGQDVRPLRRKARISFGISGRIRRGTHKLHGRMLSLFAQMICGYPKSNQRKRDAKMKKFLALILMVCMMFTMTAFAAEAEYKLGLGVVVDLESSDTENAQVDATFATVVLDAEGKIVLCRIDCAQNKMDVSDGEVDTEAEFQTKREKLEGYGMVAYGGATYEWYQQAEAFEAYVVGKTGEEVAAMETTVNDHGYNVTADETLYATCSIDITDFIEAVSKACADAKGQTFTASEGFTLGTAAISTAEESTEVTDDDDAVVKMYSEFGAVVVADGKIICAITDAIQPKISVDEDGEITETEFKGTKRELGEAYGMVAYGNAIAEWDAQAQAFANYTVGKTAEEVAAVETVENDHGYNVTADETLYASCTMDITGMAAVLSLAAEYAR